MRNKYIVGYDISDSKRLYKVHSLMLGYGDPIQYSIFSCELSGKEKMIMVTELHDLIKTSEDSVFIINLGTNKKYRKIETLGVKKRDKERKSIIL